MNATMDAQKKRIALVIGNSNYGAGNEVSGAENATAIAECLGGLGFTVLPPVLNADLETFNTKVDAFVEQIGDADVVLFFYSGHGIQLENKNYLIPTDGSLAAEKLVLLDDLIQKLGMAPSAAIKLVFLDACRDDKRLPKGAPHGMTNPSPAPPETLEAFSASPNQLAESGKPTEKSVYTKALLRYFPEPGLELVDLLDRVEADVLQFSETGQQPFVAGAIPPDFFFRDPVFVQAEIPDGGFSPLLVILNGQVALSADKPVIKDLRLNAGENDLVLLVSNGKRFHNGFTWERTEGWSYRLDLKLPDRTVTFQDHEDIPFKDGPHHGGVFTVARATLFVDPKTAEVTLKNPVINLANDEAPVWARDQDLLFEASITSLNLSVDDILGDAVSLGGLAPLVLPFLEEFLKTGEILGTKVADPGKTFATVRGNRRLKPAVQQCMTAGREDRIRDLKASIVAAFKRVPRPFEVFDEGLTACVRATAPGLGISTNPDDIRIWTAFEDRSREAPVPDAPASDPAVPPAVDAPVTGGVEASR